MFASDVMTIRDKFEWDLFVDPNTVRFDFGVFGVFGVFGFFGVFGVLGVLGLLVNKLRTLLDTFLMGLGRDGFYRRS